MHYRAGCHDPRRSQSAKPDYTICAVARTSEAKALGIKMGEPMFKMRDLCRDNGVVVFSSNYSLYGDMSRRMNEVYQRFSSDIEIYSIDESFLDLAQIEPETREEFARDLRSSVSTWTGIPTCVGIGPTKTLAKLANKIAKSTRQLLGVCNLTSVAAREEWLPLVELGDICGVGPASQAKLTALGCRTAADVAALDARQVRGLMTVVGERTILELRGQPCIDLETVAPTRKGCAVTRSFGARVEDLDTLLEAIASHAARLGEKLRRNGLATDHVTIFFHTSPFSPGPHRSVSLTVDLPEGSNDSLVLIRAARWGAKRIWKPGYRYAKAGVMTVDLVPLAMAPRADADEGSFIGIYATNYGPSDTTLKLIASRRRPDGWRWRLKWGRYRRWQYGVLISTNDVDQAVHSWEGRAVSGLPHKLVVGGEFGTYTIHRHERLRDMGIVDVGFTDVFGRYHWAPRHEVRKVVEDIRKEWPKDAT